jgi:hypothetical protein
MRNHFINVADVMVDAFFKGLLLFLIHIAGSSLQNGHLFFHSLHFHVQPVLSTEQLPASTSHFHATIAPEISAAVVVCCQGPESGL